MTANSSIDGARRLEGAGDAVLRYGLVLFLAWFGAFKFTAAEASAIQPLVAHSPFMSWLYAVADVRTVSGVVGVTELAVAALIALRPLSAKASAAGSVAAIAIFAVTLSFLATTPDMWRVVEGFPIPSGAGGFIVKDLFLLGAAIATAGTARRAARSE